MAGSSLSHLDCARCGQREDPDYLQTVCPECGGPLLARYELSREDLRGLPWDLPHRSCDLWRYAELLPVRDRKRRSGLGEGMTPLLRADRLGAALGLESFWIKDEGRNPTGSFKARGMAVAVTRAAELGVEALAAPSAGNAGLAMAAYAACHGLSALVAFPADIPPPYVRECRAYGAEVLVEGATIREAGQALKRHIAANPKWADAFDVSTLREPYRLEGKKTMGYEIAEQLGGVAPDVVLYPTGGGTGLIGIAKAFEEMISLSWMGETTRPRMIAVQMAGCAPVVEAMRAGASRVVPPETAQTRCWGLRVPSPFADREILRTVRDTGGEAVAVEEKELLPAARHALRTTGIDLAPEGAAALAAIPHLLRGGVIRPTDRIVLLNTASSAMYK
ncbi:MAG: threonine synthase [Candidatus Eisenbacteria bacterium]|nr:threonine synthase [Candidatus Latescibacterota bacterium]MBD3300958.1 threonine synthase [Candidatus Eisenbacteria bacterium]